MKLQRSEVLGLEASKEAILSTISSGPLAPFTRIGCGRVFGWITDEEPVFFLLYPAQQLGQDINGTSFGYQGTEASIQFKLTRNLEERERGWGSHSACN